MPHVRIRGGGGQRWSFLLRQTCTFTEQGEILEHRVGTRPNRFEEALGDRPRARILIEASPESERLARHTTADPVV
jgi:hypothetical protein